MRNGSHQMTKLILGHKDYCKSRLILDLSQAKRIECAVRAVTILFCTSVSCEWVSCPHPSSIFWNSFQETEITNIYQMMWNSMSSNSFAIVSLATAKLKMKTLPTGFLVALWYRHPVFRSTWQSKFSPPSNCGSCRCRC